VYQAPRKPPDPWTAVLSLIDTTIPPPGFPDLPPRPDPPTRSGTEDQYKQAMRDMYNYQTIENSITLCYVQGFRKLWFSFMLMKLEPGLMAPKLMDVEAMILQKIFMLFVQDVVEKLEERLEAYF
jgi:hypothetical protein